MFKHLSLKLFFPIRKEKFLRQIHMNISLEDLNHESEAILFAKFLLSQGFVIGIPTDTVYGFAADVQNDKAIEQIYKIKGRNLNKPIAICVSEVKNIDLWGKTKHLPHNLLNELLPGPVTVVLERTSSLNTNLNPGIDKVGIRVPNNGFVRELTKHYPLALTSANSSNKPSTLETSEFQHLWDKLGAVFDNGKLKDSFHAREGSTVVDLTENGYYSIIRSGSALKNTIGILEKFKLKNKTQAI